MKHSRRHQQGFTLVELSIVLVIIGLIIGGVLTGQQIIQNARVTNALNAIQAYQAQFQTYQQNFGALPGDDPSAATRFPNAVPLPVNGNGNGALNGTFDTTTTTDETRQVWADLRDAGLVKNQVTATNSTAIQPPNPFGGIFGFSNRGVQRWYPHFHHECPVPKQCSRRCCADDRYAAGRWFAQQWFDYGDGEHRCSGRGHRRYGRGDLWRRAILHHVHTDVGHVDGAGHRTRQSWRFYAGGDVDCADYCRPFDFDDLSGADGYASKRSTRHDAKQPAVFAHRHSSLCSGEWLSALSNARYYY